MYRATTSWISPYEAFRLDWIDGTATIVIVVSRSCMNTALRMIASTARLARGRVVSLAAAAASTAGTDCVVMASSNTNPIAGEDRRCAGAGCCGAGRGGHAPDGRRTRGGGESVRTTVVSRLTAALSQSGAT